MSDFTRVSRHLASSYECGRERLDIVNMRTRVARRVECSALIDARSLTVVSSQYVPIQAIVQREALEYQEGILASKDKSLLSALDIDGQIVACVVLSAWEVAMKDT